MSSKYRRPAPPRDPATLKVTRGDIINFMNFMSMDENFCLRVWNTVQAVYKRAEDERANPTSGMIPCDDIQGVAPQAVAAEDVSFGPVIDAMNVAVSA